MGTFKEENYVYTGPLYSRLHKCGTDWSQESHPSSGQIHVGSGQLPPQAASALVVGAQGRVIIDH